MGDDPRLAVGPRGLAVHPGFGRPPRAEARLTRLARSQIFQSVTEPGQRVGVNLVLRRLAREQELQERFLTKLRGDVAISEVWNQDQEAKQGRGDEFRHGSPSQGLQCVVGIFAMEVVDNGLLRGRQDQEENGEDQSLLQNVKNEDTGAYLPMTNLQAVPGSARTCRG